MMRAAVYVRVSSEEQVKGYSIQEQIIRTSEKARQLGATEVAVFKDEGYSGADTARPGIQNLIKEVQEGKYDLVVCHDIDRWARDLADQLAFAEMVEKHAKLEFVTHARGNPDSPEDTLFFQMKGAFAEYERSKIKQRTMFGRYAKAKEGKIVIPGGWEGHPGPYGYLYNGDKENPRFDIVEEEAKIVEKIFKSVAYDGLGIGATVTMLNEKKIPGPKGGKWHISTVRRILHNEVYIGKFYNFKYRTEAKEKGSRSRKYILRPKSQRLLVNVPKIISKDVWDLAHKKIRENGMKTRKGRKYEYLMAGRINCGLCGRKYYTTPQNNSPYYRCSGKRRHVTLKTCKSRIIPAKTNSMTLGLDDVVWKTVKERIANPDLIQKELQHSISNNDIKLYEIELKEKLAMNEKIKNELAVKKKELLDLRLNGFLTYDELKDRMKLLQKQINEVQREINDLNSELKNFDNKGDVFSFEEIYDKFVDKLELLTFEEKKEIINMLKITVTVNNTQEATIIWPFEDYTPLCGKKNDIGHSRPS
jgi:site-specific DNA recombinase